MYTPQVKVNDQYHDSFYGQYINVTRVDDREVEFAVCLTGEVIIWSLDSVLAQIRDGDLVRIG